MKTLLIVLFILVLVSIPCVSAAQENNLNPAGPILVASGVVLTTVGLVITPWESFDLTPEEFDYSSLWRMETLISIGICSLIIGAIVWGITSRTTRPRQERHRRRRPLVNYEVLE